MSIKTVLGDIEPKDLGITLMHHHILIDSGRCWWKKPSPNDPIEKHKIAKAPVTMDVLGYIRRELLLNRDNLILDSIEDCVSELIKFKEAGGNSVVDVSTPDMTPEKYVKHDFSFLKNMTPSTFADQDYSFLRKISNLTGVNIIRATGWYLHSMHPGYIGKVSVDDLSDILISDLTKEFNHSDFKAGVIKLGCSKPLHPDERKVLLAAAKAQGKTGAPICIHGDSHDANEYINIMEDDGVLEKIYLAHFDTFHKWPIERELDIHRQIMDRGVNITYDRFGEEGTYVEGVLDECTDEERIKAVVELCKQGYEKKLLLAHDIGMKILLTKYGGYGYEHILRNIVPALKYQGVTDNQIKNMLVDNPRIILSF